MPGGLITNRPLQNEATGIDLHVPLYQEIRGSMITGHVEYQIVVVTRLGFFKSTKQKTGDVVQFVVSKKYSEIDAFYHSLMTKYPSIHLPPMPRKALFVSETDLHKRRVAFDVIVKFLSTEPVLANCPELLEFLGAKTVAVDVKTINKPDRLDKEEEGDLDFFESNGPPNLTEPVKVMEKNVKPIQPSEEEEILDPLSSKRFKKRTDLYPVTKSAPKPKSKTTFDEEDDPEKKLFSPTAKGDVKMFDSMHLGISRASQNDISTEHSMNEDIDELFRIEMDLDKVHSINKTSTHKQDTAMKIKPKLKANPVLFQGSSTLTQATDLSMSRTETMNQVDILHYIQQNYLPGNDDLDLFEH